SFRPGAPQNLSPFDRAFPRYLSPPQILFLVSSPTFFVPYQEVQSIPNVVCNPVSEEVTFRASKLEDGGILCVQKRLSKQDTYDDVVRELAEKLKLHDPSTIRLTAHNCYLQQPKQSPVKFRGVDSLEDLLTHHDQTTDIVYFETLEIPLPKLERLKSLGIVLPA
ncbi:unnamed protein product, partial [Closterium sp. Naga37s-1]